jgi:hypothetical protein
MEKRPVLAPKRGGDLQRLSENMKTLAKSPPTDLGLEPKVGGVVGHWFVCILILPPSKVGGAGLDAGGGESAQSAGLGLARQEVAGEVDNLSPLLQQTKSDPLPRPATA